MKYLVIRTGQREVKERIHYVKLAVMLAKEKSKKRSVLILVKEISMRSSIT